MKLPRRSRRRLEAAWGTARPRVVVIGGGFGGLACARRLAGRTVEVILVDRRNYHQFSPLLYQVATALLTAPDIVYPLRAAFAHRSNVHLLQGEVDRIDLEHRVVQARGSVRLPYDYLVLAAGSENHYFGNERLAAGTLGLKTLPQAQRLRNHVLACVEQAAQATDPQRRRQLLTFVVIGGGPTGVEFVGALLELLKLVLGREYPELQPVLARVVLVEAADGILPAFPSRLQRHAVTKLKDRGVEVLTNTLVKDASERTVTFADGTVIAAGTVVWSAGIRAVQIKGLLELPQTAQRRIKTDDHLRVLGFPGVFAIGDLASLQVGGRELPMLSPYAIQEGRYVASAILAELRHDVVRRPFRPRDKGTLAVIGRNAAVGSIKRIQLTGLAGWIAWLGVHIYYLVGFRNRAVVMINWAWNYLRKDRPIRMITNIDHDPVADELLRTVARAAGTADPRPIGPPTDRATGYTQ